MGALADPVAGHPDRAPHILNRVISKLVSITWYHISLKSVIRTNENLQYMVISGGVFQRHNLGASKGGEAHTEKLLLGKRYVCCLKRAIFQ